MSDKIETLNIDFYNVDEGFNVAMKEALQIAKTSYSYFELKKLTFKEINYYADLDKYEYVFETSYEKWEYNRE
jgi:hypothetical protein